MKSEYREWIEAWLRKHAFVRGMCGAATSEMVAAFPELTKVRGHVMTGMGREPHWWCTDLDGSIVDPTVTQFNHTRLVYEPFDEKLAHTLPTGKCMGCGGYLYYRADFCDIDCAHAVISDMGFGVSTTIYQYKFNQVDQPMYYEDEAP